MGVMDIRYYIRDLEVHIIGTPEEDLEYDESKTIVINLLLECLLGLHDNTWNDTASGLLYYLHNISTERLIRLIGFRMEYLSGVDIQIIIKYRPDLEYMFKGN